MLAFTVSRNKLASCPAVLLFHPWYVISVGTKEAVKCFLF